MTQTPIKILHTADCHLDSPLLSLALRDAALRDRVQAATRAGFTRIVDVALDEAVAALLIAGDLFDGAERSARTAAFLTAQLDRLHAAGIAVFYIKGNHDAENPITGEVSLPDNVHVFDGRGGKVQLGGHDIWIHGVSFSGRHAPESLLGKFGAPVDGAVNIAMLHTSLAGAAGHDPYAPCSVTELAGMGFDYWALGHVHKRQVHAHRPWIVMPGMPQGRDIGEAGTKSATLLRIDGAAIGIDEIPTSAIEFLDLAVDATGMDDDAALRVRLRENLRGVSRDLPSQAAIVRLTVTGPTARRWQYLRDRDMWRETADALAADTGRIWVEKLDFDLRDPAGHDDGNAAAATDELAHLMQAIRREPAFTAALQAELDTLLAELPPQRRAKLIPDEAAATALGQALAASGAARLLALMKAAAG